MTPYVAICIESRSSSSFSYPDPLIYTGEIPKGLPSDDVQSFIEQDVRRQRLDEVDEEYADLLQVSFAFSGSLDWDDLLFDNRT